jgi:ABC-type Zn uptake system ZnuABC Zn-binding protein ZnuA
MSKRTLLIFPWALTVILLLAGQCGTPPSGVDTQRENESQKLRVIATTSIVADIVKNVGSDLIEVNLLLPLGTDPHTFEPTPRDLAAVAEADIIFANGLGLEAFLDEMLKNAGGQAVTVHISEGIEIRQLGETAGHTEEGNHQGADPHTWTSPANALVFVDNIERTLSSRDPAQAEQYAANAAAYRAKLNALDSWVKTQIETIPVENRELVTDHTAFGYYADRYGLAQIGAVIPSFSAASEPSAKELAELENAIRAYNVKAIFVGNTVNSAIAERMAQDTGLKLLPLYTGSLGTAGSGVETYLDYIKYNTNTIVDGLR